MYKSSLREDTGRERERVEGMGRNGREAKESCSRYELIAMAIHSGRLLEVVGPAAYALPPLVYFLGAS